MKQETGNVSGEAAGRQHLRAERGADMKTQGSLAGALLLPLLPGLHAQGKLPPGWPPGPRGGTEGWPVPGATELKE